MDQSHLAPDGGGGGAISTSNLHHVHSQDFHSARGTPSIADMHPAHERMRKPRKLVLCFDGTGNKFRGDDSDSNILKIFRMLDRTANDQYHYYQPGIGTYVVSSSLTRTSLRSRFKSWYMKAKDSAIGSSFDQHVVGGYRFLMRFYCPGDEIYIFGFSRGAYIARFLAEMLDYVGLLSHGNEEMVAFAWKAFSQWQGRRSDSNSEEENKKGEMYKFMKGFRETFSRPVRRIRFLGLFDTVNSVPRFETAWMEHSKSPYTARSSAKVIRHAVSIDERRAKFRSDLMYQSDNDHKRGHTRQMLHDMTEKYRARQAHTGPAAKSSAEEVEERGRRQLALTQSQADPAPYRFRSRSKSRTTHHTEASQVDNASNISDFAPSDDDGYHTGDEAEQDIDEIWFAGGHGDVGGGWEITPGVKSASHIPLAWMIREAMRAGLTFDMEKVVSMGCSDALDDSPSPAPKPSTSSKTDFATRIPTFRLNSGSQPTSPNIDGTIGSPTLGQETEPPRSDFHEMMHRAHTARVHDSLTYASGLGFGAVTSWRIMEYMPFRRMDLLPDGSWKPIRWPLPCGEVRDVPLTARVHGSVIRRMQQDEKYRPGNLIVGGGGRGCRVAPKEHGMGEWECVQDEGDPVGEVWVKKQGRRV